MTQHSGSISLLIAVSDDAPQPVEEICFALVMGTRDGFRVLPCAPAAASACALDPQAHWSCATINPSVLSAHCAELLLECRDGAALRWVTALGTMVAGVHASPQGATKVERLW